MGGSTQSTWGVPIESAKQLEFKMKFMGLVVVALLVLLSILSPATSAPAPAPVPAPKPITPALATALGAAAGDLAVAGASIPPSLSCSLPASFLLELSPLSCPPGSSLPRSSWPRGPLWQGLELLVWRQPEVEKVQQRHQA